MQLLEVKSVHFKRPHFACIFRVVWLDYVALATNALIAFCCPDQYLNLGAPASSASTHATRALQDVPVLVRNERFTARMSEYPRHAQYGYAKGGAAWSGGYANNGCGCRSAWLGVLLLKTSTHLSFLGGFLGGMQGACMTVCSRIAFLQTRHQRRYCSKYITTPAFGTSSALKRVPCMIACVGQVPWQCSSGSLSAPQLVLARGRSRGGDHGYSAYQAVQYSYGGGAGAGGSYAARVHAMAARTAYGSEREAYGESADYDTPKGGGGGGRRYSDSYGRGYEQEQGEVYGDNGYQQRGRAGGGERYVHDARRRWT